MGHETKMRFAFLIILAALPCKSHAQPPPGQSALLNGMHDMQAESWMKGATPGCDKGWITDLQYIGNSGSPGANCHGSATKAGISIIQRLDVSGSESVPKNSSQAPGYAQAFASFVSKCSDIHVWVVGNEPNFTWNKSDPDCSSAAYATAYVEVHKRVHALPGHKNDLVLVAPNSPYSPGCLQSLRMIIDKVKAKGIKPDGFALHAYTQAGSGSALTSGYVTDSKKANDNTIDQCPGGATWGDTWHWNFRIYRDYITKVIEQKNLGGAPVFISESGNACTPQKGNNCYPNSDIGYFQALYAEAAAWNKTAKTKIRAITPYRWTKNDDGTGRDFAIGDRPKLLGDLKKAFAKKHAWTKSKCGGPPPPPGCTQDKDCSGKMICDVATGKCAGTTPCSGAGTCKAGFICRQPQYDCVPICRGAAKVAWSPGKPTLGGKVSFDISAAQAYTNVGLGLEAPSGSLPAAWGGVKKIGGLYHWSYTVQVKQNGTHRATFTADPGKTSVYAICYFNVGQVSPPPPKKDGGAPGKDAAKPAKDLPAQADGLPSKVPDQGSGAADGSAGTCGVTAGPAPPWSLILLALLALRRRMS